MDVGEHDGRIHVTEQNRIGDTPHGSDPGSGLGLVGMRERVESSNGRLSIDSDGGLFRVSVQISLLGNVVR